MTTNYYPLSPQKVPAKLTALTSAYQLKASLAILAVITFFVLYFSMVAALAYLVYLAFTYDMGEINRLSMFLKFAAIAGSLNHRKFWLL